VEKLSLLIPFALIEANVLTAVGVLVAAFATVGVRKASQ
jgi:hypothetical protein